MNTYTEKVGERLNDILEKTYDAEKGFKKAAENTDNTALKAYFERKAQERYSFGHQLKEEIRQFGEEPDKEGSAAGAIHRTWMDVKAFFSADNAESMLEEALRGEKAAIEEYNDVLEDTSLPPSTKRVLMEQKNKISNGVSTIKGLEDLR